MLDWFFNLPERIKKKSHRFVRLVKFVAHFVLDATSNSVRNIGLIEKLNALRSLEFTALSLPFFLPGLSGCHTCWRSAADRMSNTRIHPHTLCCSDRESNPSQSTNCAQIEKRCGIPAWRIFADKTEMQGSGTVDLCRETISAVMLK